MTTERQADVPHDLAIVVERIDALAEKIDDLADDMRDPPRDGKAGGMLFRMTDAERRIKTLEDNRTLVKLVALNVLTALMGGASTAWVVLHVVK